MCNVISYLDYCRRHAIKIKDHGNVSKKTRSSRPSFHEDEKINSMFEEIKRKNSKKLRQEVENDQNKISD